MKNPEEVKVKIITQGAPVLSKYGHRAYVIKKGRNVIALEVNMKSKYCEPGGALGGDGDAPGIGIEATKRSLNLNMNHVHKRVTMDTYISFPEYKGWDVFTVGNGKYNMKVCLIKN